MKPINSFYLARTFYNPLFAPNLMILRNNQNNIDACKINHDSSKYDKDLITPTGEN